VLSFEVDFAEHSKFISYDKALLWNVMPVVAQVASCEAKPAYNSIQFEHKLRGLQLGDYQYLVCPPGDKFTPLRRGRDMFVRTYTRQMEQFDLLRVAGNDDTESPLYLPPKSNKAADGLIGACARGRRIPTRGEAERIVNSLDKGAGLRLAGVRIIPSTIENTSGYAGINYNQFIETKHFLRDRRLLLFSFEIKANDMWKHEIMYYALSELQQHFYEYRCVGEMVQ